MAATELDKDGASLVRFSTELPAKSASPFILAMEVDRYMFLSFPSSYGKYPWTGNGDSFSVLCLRNKNTLFIFP